MDKFVKKIFRNKVLDEEKVQRFGFVLVNNCWQYSSKLMNGQFEFFIEVKNDKDFFDVKTKLVDCLSNGVYNLHLIDEAVGDFVGKVRFAYESILNLIAKQCCNDKYFIYPQSNRIADSIKNKYNDSPEFLWEKFPRFGVFRNPKSRLWYGLISNIDKSKIDKNSKGEIEILNIKSDSREIPKLLKNKGFYPAYHMNKKHWITITLDDTLCDEKIIELIHKSYEFSVKKKAKKV